MLNPSVTFELVGGVLSDLTRGMPYKTYNLNHATSGKGTIYTDSDNTWGDSANYVEGSSTTAANGQTAGIDAHFGAGADLTFEADLSAVVMYDLIGDRQTETHAHA